MEAVLLTGGASRRMGQDKAALQIDGKSLAQLIAERLKRTCGKVTVLGREALHGCEFLRDSGEYEGPVFALSAFEPTQPQIFIASCDLVLFDARLPTVLASLIGTAQAAVPSADGRLQPLCALYAADAWKPLVKLRMSGERRVMKWLDALDVVEVPEEQLEGMGIARKAVRSANSPEDLEDLLQVIRDQLS